MYGVYVTGARAVLDKVPAVRPGVERGFIKQDVGRKFLLLGVGRAEKPEARGLRAQPEQQRSPQCRAIWTRGLQGAPSLARPPCDGAQSREGSEQGAGAGLGDVLLSYCFGNSCDVPSPLVHLI